MIIFGAAVTFLIVFVNIHYFQKIFGAQTQALTLYNELSKEKQRYATCFLAFKGNNEHSIILLKTAHIQYHNLCSPSSDHYSTLCKIERIPADVCWVLTSVWYPGFMDVISRLLPPGGTNYYFHLLLMASYHLSLRYLEEYGGLSSTSLRVDVIFDADYETGVGGSSAEFQKFVLWQLKDFFHKSQFDVHMLSVEKGSIKISFFIKRGIQNYVDKSETDSDLFFQVPKRIETKKTKKDAITVKDRSRDFLYFLKYLNYELDEDFLKFLTYLPKSLLLKKNSKREETLSLYSQEKIIHFVPLESNEMEKDSNFDVQERKKALLLKKTHSESFQKSNPSISVNIQDTKKVHHKRVIRNVQTESDDSSKKLKVRFKLEQLSSTDENDAKFHKHLKSQLAKVMRIPLPSIKDMTITKGTDVAFTLSPFNDENNVMDEQSVFEAADTFKTKISSKQCQLTDLNGQFLMAAGSAYVSLNDNSSVFSLIIIVVLCVTLLMLIILTITVVYFAKRISAASKQTSSNRTNAYRDMYYGRDSSQSIGKYSYDSGLWLGPGPEPSFTVPDAPYYRPPTVDQIASTPRPRTVVRTRLKKNWNVDADRALSTIPDNFGRPYIPGESSPR